MSLKFLVREKKSKETAAEKNIKNSKSSNDPDKDSSENNPNSNDLITSTIEETECDWEFAHVIFLLLLILYERIYFYPQKQYHRILTNVHIIYQEELRAKTGIDLKQEMAKKLKEMEVQWRKEKEEASEAFQQERKV